MFGRNNVLEAITDNEHVGVFAFDTHFRVSEWNTKMYEIFGIDRNTILRQNIFDFFPPFANGEHKSNYQKALLSKKISIKNGYFHSPNTQEGVYFEASFTPVSGDSQETSGAIGMVWDTTELHQQHSQKIEISENLLHGIVDSTDMIIATLDTNFNFLLSNQAHRQVFQNISGQNIQLGDNLLEKLAHLPEKLERFQYYWTKALTGEKFTILESFTDSKDKDEDFYEVSYSPLLDKKGNVVAATAISKNVTERIKQEKLIQELLESQIQMNENLEMQNEELATQEEEIRQTNEELVSTNNQLSKERRKLIKIAKELKERNFDLDQIMYKTSHDIRSPITSVMGLLNIIKEEEDLCKIREYLEFLERRTLDLDRFTKSMLNYGKSQRAEQKVENIDFENIIKHCFEDLKYLPTFDRLNKKIKIDAKYPFFHQDAFRLNILFSNIISNAVKYQNQRAEKSFLKIQVNIEKDMAEISFEDNGIGVSEEYKAKVFDMFFRATEKSDGSGLGMYIVKQTIKKLNGKIEFESELGKGTTVKLQIPNLAYQQFKEDKSLFHIEK